MKKSALLLALFASTTTPASAKNTLFPFSQNKNYIAQSVCHTAKLLVDGDSNSKVYQRFLEMTVDIKDKNGLTEKEMIAGMMWVMGYSDGLFVASAIAMNITKAEYAKMVINDVCAGIDK
ncbi:exported hypothetical protein [Vibrio jasicida]|uniref:hypothetical protein n=1 Tax=Vibrio jasicida TaxID=766224 RepID=UPI002895028B|nr:exported hypothetical protein [Vibrio jasicida]